MTRLDARIYANICKVINKNYQKYRPLFLMENQRMILCGISHDGMMVAVSFLKLDEDDTFIPVNERFNCKKKGSRNNLKRLLVDLLTSLNRTDHMYVDESDLYSQFGYFASGITR